MRIMPSQHPSPKISRPKVERKNKVKLSKPIPSVLIGILILFAIAFSQGFLDYTSGAYERKSKRFVDISQNAIDGFAETIVSFKKHCGRLPSSPSEMVGHGKCIRACPDFSCVPKGLISDHWGKEYIVKYDEKSVTASTYGSDGVENGSGDSQDFSSTREFQ